MNTNNDHPPLAPREQRVLEALRGLAPPDSHRVVVSINDLANQLGMQPGEASRAVIKLWLLRRIRGYQEPRGADPSEFEIVDDDPNTNTTEPNQPALLSVSANTNTSETVPSPASAVVPAASAPEGDAVAPKEGGRGEVPNDDDGPLNDDDGNDATFDDNDANVEVFRCNDGTSNVNDGNVERKENNDGNDGVVAGGGSRGEEPAPLSRPAVPATSPSASVASTTTPASVMPSGDLQHIGGMFPDLDAMAAPRRGTDPTRDLACECASALNDTDNLRAYLKLANHFPEARLREALATVLALPKESVLRPGALFTHLVKRGT